MPTATSSSSTSRRAASMSAPRREIYALVNKLAEAGKAVLVISSEHQELFGLCDRVLVMGEGELRGELHAGRTTARKTCFRWRMIAAKHITRKGWPEHDGDQRSPAGERQRGSISATFLQRFGTLGIFLVLVVVASLLVATSFLTKPNILNVLRQVASGAGIMAVGMLFVILTRGIDLSVGSVAALGSVLTRLFHRLFRLSASPTASCSSFSSGAACGLVTGGFVAYLQAAVLRHVARDDGDRARAVADHLGGPADPARRRRRRARRFRLRLPVRHAAAGDPDVRDLHRRRHRAQLHALRPHHHRDRLERGGGAALRHRGAALHPRRSTSSPARWRPSPASSRRAAPASARRRSASAPSSTSSRRS